MEIWSNGNTTRLGQLPFFYILVPFAGLLLVVVVTFALACHIRKRRRLDELRHKLIPMYEYDPGEQEPLQDDEEDEEEWDDKDEEEQLKEPLCGEGVGLRGKLLLKQD